MRFKIKNKMLLILFFAICFIVGTGSTYAYKMEFNGMLAQNKTGMRIRITARANSGTTTEEIGDNNTIPESAPIPKNYFEAGTNSYNLDGMTFYKYTEGKFTSNYKVQESMLENGNKDNIRNAIFI